MRCRGARPLLPVTSAGCGGSFLVITREDPADPEHQALLADSVGLALVVVPDTLTPAERLAFVLHDVFDVPFDEIARMIGRSPGAARQLASRARRRVQGAGGRTPGTDLGTQRARVSVFFAATRAERPGPTAPRA